MLTPSSGMLKAQNNDGAPATPALDPDSISPSEIPLKDLLLLKLAAQLLARYGFDFWFLLKDKGLFCSALFGSKLFYWLLTAYKRVLDPYTYFRGVASLESEVERFLRSPPLENFMAVETETDMVELHAFVDGIDSLVHMDYAYYSAIMPQPERFSSIMNKLTPQHAALIQYGVQPDASAQTNPPLNSISLVELGIFKLTALFEARYGLSFRRALMRRVVTNPQFEFLFFRPDLKMKVVFLEETESRYYLFSRLVGAYTRAVNLYGIGSDDEDDFPATLLEFYFDRLQLAKLDEGVIDLHAFVRGVDYFARMETPDYDDVFPPPERLSVMMNRPRPLGSQFTEYPAQDQVRRDLSSKLPPVKGVGLFWKNDPMFRFPATREITLKELGIIKLTAQFCVRYGRHLESWLFKRTGRFEFVLPSNSWFNLYITFLSAYTSVLKFSKKGEKSDDACAARVVKKFLHRVERLPTATAMIDLHAFVGGVDYFAYTCDENYSACMAQPERLSMMIIRGAEMQPDTLVQIPMGSQSAKPDLDPDKLRLPQWAILVEHGIMKLTAMFVARYGMYFYWVLWKKVGMKPQFKFMEPTDKNFKVFNRIADAYEGVLKPADRFETKDNACTESFVDAFLSRLQLEKLEEGDVTAMLDLHAFVCGVDDFADVDPICWDQEDFMCSELLSALLSRLIIHVSPQLSPGTHLFERKWSIPLPGMSPRSPPEEAKLKRRKVEKLKSSTPGNPFAAYLKSL